MAFLDTKDNMFAQVLLTHAKFLATSYTVVQCTYMKVSATRPSWMFSHGDHFVVEFRSVCML